MDIKGFYDEIGSDVSDVEKRLGSLTTAEYFVKKFAKDQTYPALTEAYKSGDSEKAFRAVHTLKGLCANLGFDKLYASSSVLTEALRGNKPVAGTEIFYEAVKKDYETLIATLEKMD